MWFDLYVFIKLLNHSLNNLYYPSALVFIMPKAIVFSNLCLENE